MYYLYLKTHNATGLKYLGYTTQDPNKYLGSGLYWRRHLKAHGNNVTTKILLETDSYEELCQAGIEFSNRWQVVDSEEFANLIIECGTGVSSADARAEVLRRLDAGTHNLVGSSRPSPEIYREATKKSVKVKLAAGTHNFQGEKNPAKRRNHHLAKKVPCVDVNGHRVTISSEEYGSQISTNKRFVHSNSKEGRRRLENPV